MKYLFFDIECSNCFQGIGKMCEFGYVLTDENFKIIRKDDIPMSPGKGRGNRFHLRGRKDQRDLELAYDEELYFSQKEFPSFYDRIKLLIEDKDTICFAYSMENDIFHLYHSCKRYKLEPFNYTCYDVQRFVAAYLEKKGQMSLLNACKTIVGPHSVVKLQEHLSRDDAEMERMIFEAICTLQDTNSLSLLSKFEFAKTTSSEFIEKHNEHERKKKQKTAGHDLYNSLAVDESELDKPENIGRRYNFSGDLKANMEVLKNAIELVKEKNGLLCNKIGKTDYFIAFDDKNKEEIIKSFKRPFDGKVLTFDEFNIKD